MAQVECGVVVKAFIAQAKRVDDIPDDISKLPDLSDQKQDMEARTDEAYILLYGSKHVEFRHCQKMSTRLTVSSVMGDAMRCKRGDRRREIIAEALDRDLVLEIVIAGPGAMWPYSPGTLT